MPISKANLLKYPKDWNLRSYFVRIVRGKSRCEWCGVANYQIHPISHKKQTLTCAHIYDHRPEASSLLNLACLCNKCHNKHDGKHRAANASVTRQLKKKLLK
jgi:hypothetical protein